MDRVIPANSPALKDGFLALDGIEIVSKLIKLYT